MEGQELHDKLREGLPEGADCLDDCPYHADKPEKASKEGQVSDNAKVFDQETVDSLLDAARSKAADEARAEMADELTAAKDALEAKDEELTKAEAKVASLESENTEREDKARLDELADERSDKVAEVTKFSAEQLEERKAGWAKLDEDNFETVLADLKEVSESAEKAKGEGGKPKIPKTKLEGDRETAGNTGTDTEQLKNFFGTLQDA
jgi:hypothetical protein